MKADITLGERETVCDLCGKNRQCIQIYRNAKRGELQNFLVYICKPCAELILDQIHPTHHETGARVNDHQQLALQALENMRGDDLYRAQMAFAGMTDKELNEQHGESGKTRLQIIQEYKDHDRRVAKAIQWLKGLP